MDYLGAGGEGGGQRVCWPPLKKILGGGLFPPLPTPINSIREISSNHSLPVCEV